MQVTVKFNPPPRITTDNYAIRILSFASTGIVLDENKENPISILDVTTIKNPITGIIKVNDINSNERNYGSVTYNQLLNGVNITGLTCQDDMIIIESEGICELIKDFDIFGLYGNPIFKITLENPNDPNAIFTVRATILPNNNITHYPVQTGITITQQGIGTTNSIIKLYRGEYKFSVLLSNVSGSIDNSLKTVTLSFEQCGDYDFIPPNDELFIDLTNICEKWINSTNSIIEGVSYYECDGNYLCEQIIDINETICVRKNTLNSCGLIYYGICE